MKKFKVVDLFSGVGGFSIGFLKSKRYKIEKAIDYNTDCEDFHKLNYPDIDFQNLDLSIIDPKKYWKNKKVDVLIGGPPCQGFSTIGNRASSIKEKRNKYDLRNNLVKIFIDHLRVLKPKYFVMENVKGLISYNKGNFIKEIMNEIKKIGIYNFDYKLMNAADYNVPQIRYRTFIFGNSIGYKGQGFPKKVLDEKNYLTVESAISDLEGKENSINNHVPLNHREKNLERYKYIPEGGRLPENNLPEHLYRKNFGNTFKRLHRKKPSLTMVPGHNAFPLHPTLDRSLTVREAARIQTFTDDLTFVGSRQSQCIQVGNAVPPNLSYEWAKHILNILDKK